MDIINHFSKLGYNFIDLSKIIITSCDWYKFINNDKNDRINKTYSDIYFINLGIVSSEISKLFINYFKIQYNKCTVFLNKDNWVINNNNKPMSIFSMKGFLEKENNYNYNCNICFNEFTIIMCCPQCNFQYCKECLMKIKNNNKIICTVCKYNIL